MQGRLPASSGEKSLLVGAPMAGAAAGMIKLDPENIFDGWFNSIVKGFSSLKKEGMLTRDARKRQRRMVGTGGKSRRQKQFPKR